MKTYILGNCATVDDKNLSGCEVIVEKDLRELIEKTQEEFYNDIAFDKQDMDAINMFVEQLFAKAFAKEGIDYEPDNPLFESLCNQCIYNHASCKYNEDPENNKPCKTYETIAKRLEKED